MGHLSRGQLTRRYVSVGTCQRGEVRIGEGGGGGAVNTMFHADYLAAVRKNYSTLIVQPMQWSVYYSSPL